MEFHCIIPASKRAFEVPGSRADIRVSFELPEQEVTAGLKLILLRGRLFKMRIFKLLYAPLAGKSEDLVETKIHVVETWASIAPKASAIRIDGREDGISITLSIPSGNEKLFSKFLSLREEPLLIEIDEDSYKEV